MKKIFSALLLLTLLLGACSPAPAATQTESAPQATEAATDESQPAEAAQDSAKREAVVSEIKGDVQVSATSAEELAPASDGVKLFETGSVTTGDESGAKLSLMPEGTTLRVGPNSSFTIPVLNEENGAPKSKIQLLFGKIFVILNGGSVDVETPSGVASVRGSLLSVEYDPENKRIVATCLEGDCKMWNGEDDGEEYDIPEGYESFMGEDGEFIDPFEMDQDEVEAWLEYSDDIDSYMDELPDPEDYEDIDIEDESWFDENGDDQADDGSGFDDAPADDGSGDDEVPADDDAPADDGGGDDGGGDDGG